MNLFIEFRDGSPIGHPISEDNLKALNPNFSAANLPPNLVPFVRTTPSIRANYYQQLRSTYVVKDGVVTEEWFAEPLPENVLALRIANSKASAERYVAQEIELADKVIPALPETFDASGWVSYRSTLKEWVFTDPCKLGIPPRPEVPDGFALGSANG